MSSLFGLAEQVFSVAAGGGQDNQVHKTGGQEYNSPHHRQQPQGRRFDTDEVLNHADDVDDEDKGRIAQAMQHVHNNSQQHHEELTEDDQPYGRMIADALSAVSSNKGMDVASLVSGAMGGGGGNQLMGLVMSQVGKSLGGGGEEKQSMMNGVAMTMAKLVAQQQLSAFIGGSNSGGLGSILGIGETLLKSRFG